MHARISLEEEDDDLVQKQLFTEHESSQRDRVALSSTTVQATISLDKMESPKRPSPGKHNAPATPPRNLTTGHQIPKQQSPPLGSPNSNKAQFDRSSPATIDFLKRDGDDFGESPRNPFKRPRVTIARMIMEEDHAAKDSKEMARANRHRFNDRLSFAAGANTPIIPSKSLPNSPISKEVIPCTDPTPQPVESLLPEPQFSSSGTDGVQHVPATFQEPSSIPRPLTLQDFVMPTQTTEINCCSDPAILIQEVEVDGFSDAEEDDAILRGSFLPLMEPETHSQLDFYDEFMCVYPDYLGSKNDFTWALVYIEWLREGKQFLHRALCDDFIRVLSPDYMKYAAESESLTGKVQMTGWEYFHAKNENPVFKYEVITPENLQDALASLNAEQVSEYRRKFAERVQDANEPDSLLQRSSMLVAPTQRASNMESPSAAFMENASSKVLVSEEQASSNAREVSPELGSASNPNISGSAGKPSLFSTSRGASPKLGSVKWPSSGSIHHIPRKPYFETHSQLPSHQIETTHSRPSTVIDLTSRDQKTRSRTLPWVKDESPRTSPASPILGSVNKSSSRPPRANSSRPSSHEPDVFKQPSSPASKVSSLSRTNLPKQIIDDPEKVERWRTEVPPSVKRKASFQDWISRRKSAGALSSNVSTPSSTPNKRLCTKPAKVTPERFEPQTQGWGY
jgi:hypothetical protein